MLKLSKMGTNQRVIDALKKQGRSKKWLSEQLGVSRPTLDSRLRENVWKLGELMLVESLLGIYEPENGRVPDVIYGNDVYHKALSIFNGEDTK